MIGFYTFPRNFITAQDDAETRIICNNNTVQSVGPGSYTLRVGGLRHSAFFTITSGATKVNSFSASTQNTDRNFYLEDIGGRQYTLHHYTSSTLPLGINVEGTNSKIYRAMLIHPIIQMDPDQMFTEIDPLQDNSRRDILQESTQGNLSVARHANASSKRVMRYRTGRNFEKDNLDALEALNENHVNFTFIRNTLMHYNYVFPANFGGEGIRAPYGGWDWNAGYRVSFPIFEQ